MASALIIGSVVSAAASVFSGIQKNVQGKKEAAAMESAADRTEVEALAAASRIRARSRRMAATQRARFAAGGAELSGVAVDVQYDTNQQFEIDASNEIYKGSSRAENLYTQANVARTSGTNSLITGFANAGGSILGGMGKYNAYKTNPSFGSYSFGGQ